MLSVTTDWLRCERLKHARTPRRQRALRRRVRAWAIRIGQRYGADGIGKLNVPGGWSRADAAAQIAGMAAVAAQAEHAVEAWLTGALVQTRK